MKKTQQKAAKATKVKRLGKFFIRENSFRRIAQDHRSYARSHGFVAKQKGIVPHDKLRHRSLSVFHRETADIFAAEVKRLKAGK